MSYNRSLKPNSIVGLHLFVMKITEEQIKLIANIGLLALRTELFRLLKQFYEAERERAGTCSTQ